MSEHTSPVDHTAANVAMFMDIIPTRARPKLARVEAGTAEFDYMLAALLFDLLRKSVYLHRALRDACLGADPTLTQRNLREIRQLDALGQDYQAIAYAAEEMLLAAVADTADDHLTMAELVCRLHGLEVPEAPAEGA
ncbi:MAG: hypothetical protein D6701_05655 [Gemmatimonadetes bacterium]|nr:MAG: hypothetical protein D6701_05655 [Gemmatimonadota bacterium]